MSVLLLRESSFLPYCFYYYKNILSTLIPILLLLLLMLFWPRAWTEMLQWDDVVCKGLGSELRGSQTINP